MTVIMHGRANLHGRLRVGPGPNGDSIVDDAGYACRLLVNDDTLLRRRVADEIILGGDRRLRKSWPFRPGIRGSLMNPFRSLSAQGGRAFLKVLASKGGVTSISFGARLRQRQSRAATAAAVRQWSVLRLVRPCRLAIRQGHGAHTRSTLPPADGPKIPDDGQC